MVSARLDRREFEALSVCSGTFINGSFLAYITAANGGSAEQVLTHTRTNSPTLSLQIKQKFRDDYLHILQVRA